MTACNRIIAHAARAAHELELTAAIVGAVAETLAADARRAAAWALYGAAVVLEQPRLFRAELERCRAFAGV